MNIQQLRKNEINLYSIHYSCEPLSDTNDEISPRITSITLIHFTSRTAHSFSLHLEAEIKKINISEIKNNYDELERSMLEKFFTHIKACPNNIYIHWNMRSIVYGFEALQHRYHVLTGNEPYKVPDNKRFNLNDLLKEKYCENYVSHTRMHKLMELNDGEPHEYLSGKDEAACFAKSEFIKMYKSSYAKAEWFRWIFYLAANNELKVEKYGIPQKINNFLESTTAKVIGFVAIIITIIQAISMLSQRLSDRLM